MNYPDDHPSSDIRNAFVKLSDRLCMWKRETGRRSVLIYREMGGFTYRCMDGKPGISDDVTDEMLLKLFAAQDENAGPQQEIQHMEVDPGEMLAWCGVNRHNHDVMPHPADVTCLACLRAALLHYARHIFFVKIKDV